MSLNYSNIKTEKDRNRLEIIVTKTKRRLTIPLSAAAIRIINLYTVDKAKDTDSLFPQVANQVINRNLKELMKLAGIDKYISFHCSRHAFAVMHIEARTEMIYIKELMGHREISQTEIYAKATNGALFKSMKHLETVYQNH